MQKTFWVTMPVKCEFYQDEDGVYKLGTIYHPTHKEVESVVMKDAAILNSLTPFEGVYNEQQLRE